MGASMEVAKYTERLVPSTRFVAVDGVAPAVSESAAFVAPSASVIGNVSLGSKSRYVFFEKTDAFTISTEHDELIDKQQEPSLSL